MSGEQHTFVFADLAGFTALTEAHGDERAADIALEFCSEINRQLPEDAEDLKMLGDACLVRVGEAREAVELGLGLAGDLARRHGFPDVRIGMHTGSAARRGADWFGSTINIAARVSEIAGPCEVLLTAATWHAAGPMPGVEFEERGPQELRHVVAPVDLYHARTAGVTGRDDPWAIDPVCQMRLKVAQAATSLDHEGARFHFCSEECADRFALSPERYIRDASRAER